jgi:hypothetical protein
MMENKLHSTYTIAAVPNTKKKGPHWSSGTYTYGIAVQPR